MNIIRNHLRILVICLSLLVTACGGGVLLLASGGIGGTGISLGPILAFGSIWVNGVEFDTSNAEIYVDGNFVTTGDAQIEDHLAAGQVVRVEGTNNGDGTGTADRVYFNDNVEGPIEVITPIDTNSELTATIKQLSVMGQVVIVDEHTKFVATTLATLAEDNLVEVSGLVDSSGKIHASFMRKKLDIFTPGSSVELKGVIDQGSVNAITFTINGLLVNYAGADISNLLPTGPVAGMYVEIKGTYDGTQLNASKVEFDTEFDSNDGYYVEIESIVSSVSSYSAPKTIVFFLGQQEVHTDDTTVFKGGLPTDIVVGSQLEAEGFIDSGILIAQEIEFEDRVEMESTVDTSSYSVAFNTLTLTLDGMASITVIINSLTDIATGDGTVSNLDTFLSDGLTPDHVDIRGRLNSNNEVIATEIKVENGSSKTDATLQGPASAISDPIITIINHIIDTSGFADNDFEGLDDGSSTRNIFFTTVTDGDTVSVEGEVVGGTITWEKIKLENDE